MRFPQLETLLRYLEDYEVVLKQRIYEWRQRKGKRTQLLYEGLILQDKMEISVCKRNSLDDRARILLHELLHIRYPERSERDILKTEEGMWMKLGHLQKEALKSYVIEEKEEESDV